MLSEDFKHRDLVEKARARRVRTPGGAKKYGQPIGTVIRRDMLAMMAAEGVQATGAGKKILGIKDGDKKAPAKRAPAARKAPAKRAAAPKKPGLRDSDWPDPHAALDAAKKKKAAAAAPKSKTRAKTPEPPKKGVREVWERALKPAQSARNAMRTPTDVKERAKSRPAANARLDGHIRRVRGARNLADLAQARVDYRADSKLDAADTRRHQAFDQAYDKRRAELEADAANNHKKRIDQAQALADIKDRIRNAKNQGDLDKIKADVRGNKNLKDAPRERINALNDAFKQAQQDIRNGVSPDSAEKKRRWESMQIDKINHAVGNDELDALAQEYEEDADLPQSDKDKMAGHIAQRREAIERLNKISQARVAQRINDAKFSDDLVDAVEELNELVDRNGIDPTQADRLFDAIQQKHEELEAARPDASEAAKKVKAHFQNPENGIGQAPSEGLWAFIQNDKSGRFQVKPNGARGISPNFWVTDTGKKPPERWMFKQTAISENDVMWENLAAGLMTKAGLPMPQTKYATGAHGDEGGDGMAWLAQRHFQEETGIKGNLIGHRKFAGYGRIFPEYVDRLRKGSDPDSVSRLLIFDYLINNKVDRHGNNILFVDEGGGRGTIGIIDQGYAFGNAGNRTEITPREFFSGYRAHDWGIMGAAKGIAGTNENLLDQFNKTIDAFGKVDLDALMADLTERGLNRNDQTELKKWVDSMKWRLDYLKNNRDEMVKIVNERA